jgi:hypothetical protein
VSRKGNSSSLAAPPSAGRFILCRVRVVPTWNPAHAARRFQRGVDAMGKIPSKEQLKRDSNPVAILNNAQGRKAAEAADIIGGWNRATDRLCIFYGACPATRIARPASGTILTLYYDTEDEELALVAKVEAIRGHCCFSSCKKPY